MKELSSTGRSCIQKWLHLWRYLTDLLMWGLRTRFSVGLGSVRFMVKLDDLKVYFQTKQYYNFDSKIIIFPVVCLCISQINLSFTSNFFHSRTCFTENSRSLFPFINWRASSLISANTGFEVQCLSKKSCRNCSFAN